MDSMRSRSLGSPETHTRADSHQEGSYLCTPLPHPGGRWPPAPARWLAAHPPRCPAAPWQPEAGKMPWRPSACLQAGGGERRERPRHGGETGIHSLELRSVCRAHGRFTTAVNYPRLSWAGFGSHTEASGKVGNAICVWFGMQGRFYSVWEDLSRLQFALSSGLDAKIKEPKCDPGASRGRRDGNIKAVGCVNGRVVDPRTKQGHRRAQRKNRTWGESLKGGCGN